MDRYPEMCRRPGIEIISLYFQGLAATYGYPVGWNSSCLLYTSDAADD